MFHQEYQGPDEAGEPHLGGIEQLMRDEQDKPYLKITQRLRLDQVDGRLGLFKD